MKVLIFGCGFSGKAIGERLSANGLTVAGTTRSENKFDGCARPASHRCRLMASN